MRRRLFLGMAGAAVAATPAHADDLDVIVLGGGLAGLAAGRALVADKKKVLVLEARDRIGGRALTDTSLGFPIDLGASWLTPGPLAKEFGGRLLPGPDVGAIVMGGRPLNADQMADYAKAAERMAALVKDLRSRMPDADPVAFIRPLTPNEVLAFGRILNKPPFAIAQPLEGGLGSAVARFGAKVPVKLNTRVLRIDSTAEKIEVVTTTGTLLARVVIVALPTSVLGGGHMGFSPPLSQKKREALAATTMASNLRIALSFQPGMPKAPAESRVAGVTRAGLPFDIFVRPKNRDAAIVVLESAAARQIEETGANAAGAFGLQTMAEVYGNDVRAAFKGSVASRWGRDPFASGAWCLPPRGAVATLAAPHGPRVFFAGEAMADPAGTLEAAYASGLRSAAEAKAALR